MNISRILAHAFSFRIRDLCHIHAIACGGFHNNIKGRHFGIIGEVGPDPESNFGTAVKMLLNLVGLLKIQAVAKEQSLGFRINIQIFIMVDHFLAPLDWVSAVVSHTAEECGVG